LSAAADSAVALEQFVGVSPIQKLRHTERGWWVWLSVTRCDKGEGGSLRRYVTLSNFQPTEFSCVHIRFICTKL